MLIFLLFIHYKSWFLLPPVMEYYYAPLHPEYKPMPAFDPSCLKEGEQLMEFIFPKKNETIVLPKNFDEQEDEVVFKVAHRSVQTTVYWYLDRQYVGKTETFHELSLTPTPGKHVLTVVDQQGNELHKRIEILKAS